VPCFKNKKREGNAGYMFNKKQDSFSVILFMHFKVSEPENYNNYYPTFAAGREGLITTLHQKIKLPFQPYNGLGLILGNLNYG